VIYLSDNQAKLFYFVILPVITITSIINRVMLYTYFSIVFFVSVYWTVVGE
jgi:hypothetical protein